MNSHAVEISIAGCVEEMVRDPNLMPFFFLLFFNSYALYYQLLGTKTAWSASYDKEKTPSPDVLSTLAPGKKLSTQVPMV